MTWINDFTPCRKWGLKQSYYIGISSCIWTREQFRILFVTQSTVNRVPVKKILQVVMNTAISVLGWMKRDGWVWRASPCPGPDLLQAVHIKQFSVCSMIELCTIEKASEQFHQIIHWQTYVQPQKWQFILRFSHNSNLSLDNFRKLIHHYAKSMYSTITSIFFSFTLLLT